MPEPHAWEHPVPFAQYTLSPKSCVSSLAYGVSPQPAQAAENSHSGCRNWLPLIEYGVKLKRCERCGQFFTVKGNYDARYCNRIHFGEIRTCRDLAAEENYKNKMAENKALPIYRKYYRRYSARVKVNQIKQPDFKKWKYAALTKRDDCSNGKITVEKYIDWNEAYFPNRKRKDKQTAQ